MKTYASKAADGSVGVRFVQDTDPLALGEVEVQIPPGIDPPQWRAGKIWDDANGPRDPTAAETLQKARTDQEKLVRNAANAHYEATTRSFEGAIITGKYGRGGLTALNAEERIVFDTMSADYVRLKGLIVDIRQATTIEAIRAIVW